MTSGIVWLVANGRFNDLEDKCNKGCTTQARRDGIDDVVRLDDWALGLAIGGAVLVGTGAVLQWALPRSEARHAFLTVDPASRTLRLGGRF